MPTTVAVVARRANDGVLLIYKNLLSVALAGGANWASNAPNGAALNSNSSSMVPVAFGSSGTTFFLAYNGLLSSGIVMIPQAGGPLYIEFAARRLNAAAFLSLSLPNDVQIYAVFDTLPQLVYTMRWSSYSSEVAELFLPQTEAGIKQLFVSQTSNTNAVFIAHAGSMLVADNIQRTFTQIQGIPPGTRPDLIGAMTGASLIAASGDRIFLLDTKQCVPPRYWDGVSCLQPVCIRSRPCANNEVWSPSSMKCVCKAGFSVSSPGMICSICPVNFYCNQGNRTLCGDGKTTYPGATDASDCTCKDGQYINRANNKCEACRAGYFCPNRINMLPCPGKASSSSSTGSNSPKTCECDAGAEGPACEQCSGTSNYCPRTTRVAFNYAITATVLSVKSINSVCDTIGDVFRRYISVDTAARARVWCQYYTDESVVAIMIQSDIGSSAFLSMPMLLKGINASFIIDRITPPGDSASVDTSVKVNEPTPCPVGQLGQKPSPDYTRCVCDAGYSSNDGGIVQTYCTACQENFFGSDGISCEACPRGKYAPKASPSCVFSSASATRRCDTMLALAMVLLFVARFFL
jgi:hypothetical protein